MIPYYWCLILIIGVFFLTIVVRAISEFMEVNAARSRSRRPMHEDQTIWGQQRQRTNLCKSMLTTAGMLNQAFLRTLSDMLIHDVSEKATLWGVQDLRLTAQSIHFLINPWNYQICHFWGSSQSGINRWCWGKSVWNNITWNCQRDGVTSIARPRPSTIAISWNHRCRSAIMVFDVILIQMIMTCTS